MSLTDVDMPKCTATDVWSRTNPWWHGNDANDVIRWKDCIHSVSVIMIYLVLDVQLIIPIHAW